MNNKELLLEKINEKKAELSRSRRTSESWNPGRTKQFGNSQVSKLNVKSLEKEIKDLSDELRKLQN